MTLFMEFIVELTNLNRYCVDKGLLTIQILAVTRLLTSLIYEKFKKVNVEGIKVKYT